MSRLLTWRDEWSLHIPVLDGDHQALIEHLASLCRRFCPEASGRRSGDANALLEGLEALGEQMREHFRREEALMQAIDYAGMADHCSEHALLMAEYTTLLREWRAAGLTVFNTETQETLRHWLLAHILVADREFATAYFQLSAAERGLYDETWIPDEAPGGAINAIRRYR